MIKPTYDPLCIYRHLLREGISMFNQLIKYIRVNRNEKRKTTTLIKTKRKDLAHLHHLIIFQTMAAIPAYLKPFPSTAFLCLPNDFFLSLCKFLQLHRTLHLVPVDDSLLPSFSVIALVQYLVLGCRTLWALKARDVLHCLTKIIHKLNEEFCGGLYVAQSTDSLLRVTNRRIHDRPTPTSVFRKRAKCSGKYMLSGGL